ncbi:unnamed protein product [Rhizophagus irregularis]|nr:unnamed protein product [Rhizophagus irregularis]
MDASNDIQYSIEKWHRYIEIDTQKIDIDLLRKLFNGKAITEINANQCSTIISKGSRTKNVNVHLLRLYGNISRKYTKSIFNKETLQEIHMSFQSVYSKQFDLHNYVHKIDFFGNRLALIVCMLEKQAQLLQLNSYDDYCNLILSYYNI